ncbi:hypothetical protein AAC387_Pa04g1088 [Persea americana]
MEKKTIKQKEHLLGQREEVDETVAAETGDGRGRSVSFEKQSCISYIYTIYEGGGNDRGKKTEKTKGEGRGGGGRRRKRENKKHLHNVKKTKKRKGGGRGGGGR